MLTRVVEAPRAHRRIRLLVLDGLRRLLVHTQVLRNQLRDQQRARTLQGVRRTLIHLFVFELGHFYAGRLSLSRLVGVFLCLLNHAVRAVLHHAEKRCVLETVVASAQLPFLESTPWGPQQVQLSGSDWFLGYERRRCSLLLCLLDVNLLGLIKHCLQTVSEEDRYFILGNFSIQASQMILEICVLS